MRAVKGHDFNNVNCLYVTVTEGRPWARGLVNAVLRQFIRKKSELKMERHSAQTLWNHPQWLIDAIQQSWPDHWERVLRAKAGVQLRCSPREIEAGD